MVRNLVNLLTQKFLERLLKLPNQLFTTLVGLLPRSGFIAGYVLYSINVAFDDIGNDILSKKLIFTSFLKKSLIPT